MQNVHQEITNQIVKSIENGNTKPWRCPWVGSGEPAFPANAITGNQYQGINVLLLWWAANEYGFSSNQWLTYKQARGAGGHVIKGESGMKCLFYRKYETQDGKDPDKVVERYAANRFVLFNRDQVEGLKNEDLPTIIDDDARHESIDELAKPYLKSEKIRVIIGGNSINHLTVLFRV